MDRRSYINVSVSYCGYMLCVIAHVYRCGSPCAHEHQGKTLSVLPNHSLPCFLKTASLLNPELMGLQLV